MLTTNFKQNFTSRPSVLRIKRKTFIDAKKSLIVTIKNVIEKVWTYGPPFIVIGVATYLSPISLPIGVATCSATIYGINKFYDFLNSFNPTHSEIEEINEIKEINNHSILLMPFITTIGPVTEEICCRGLIPDFLWNEMGVRFGPAIIVASALIFGLSHLTNYPLFINSFKAVVVQSRNATIMGLMYGVVALYFGILPTIIAHVIHNTLAMNQ